MGYVVQAIQVGIDDGTVRQDVVPLELAIQLWATSTGLIQMYHTKRDELAALQEGLDMENVVKSYYQLIGRAITTKKD